MSAVVKESLGGLLVLDALMEAYRNAPLQPRQDTTAESLAAIYRCIVHS